MLIENDICDYCKRKISWLPYINLSDEDILDHCLRFAIKKFGTFDRVLDQTVIRTGDPIYQTEDRGVFKFFDKKNRTIYSIVSVQNTSNLYYLDQLSALTRDDLVEWLVDKFYADTMQTFVHNIAWTYIKPNKVRINPISHVDSVVGIRYERAHELHEIPGEHEEFFLELCCAYVKEWVASMRIDTVTTTFGDINTNASELRSEANEFFQKFEEFAMKSPPNIMMYVE